MTDFALRNRAGIFLCTCPRPVVDHSNAGARHCGYPIVARMHPDLQTRMDTKWPAWRDQVVTVPEQVTA